MRIFFSHRLDEVENKRSILDHPRIVIDIALNLIPINLWVFISVLHRGFVPLTTDYVARAYINIDIVFNTHRQLHTLSWVRRRWWSTAIIFILQSCSWSSTLFANIHTIYPFIRLPFVIINSIELPLDCYMRQTGRSVIASSARRMRCGWIRSRSNQMVRMCCLNHHRTGRAG